MSQTNDDYKALFRLKKRGTEEHIGTYPTLEEAIRASSELHFLHVEGIPGHLTLWESKVHIIEQWHKGVI